MSMEAPEIRPEDKEVAMELFNSEPLLQSDERSQYVIEHDGVTPDGRVVDIGNFLASRLDALKSEQENGKVAAMNIDDSTVVNSVRPDLENRIN